MGAQASLVLSEKKLNISFLMTERHRVVERKMSEELTACPVFLLKVELKNEVTLIPPDYYETEQIHTCSGTELQVQNNSFITVLPSTTI